MKTGTYTCICYAHVRNSQLWIENEDRENRREQRTVFQLGREDEV